MKALMGEIAKKVRKDPKGREGLRAFVINRGSDSATITLKDGKKYIVSRRRPEVKENAA